MPVPEICIPGLRGSTLCRHLLSDRKAFFCLLCRFDQAAARTLDRHSREFLVHSIPIDRSEIVPDSDPETIRLEPDG